jgi:UDP:flavonoid glycosyltransferase YjiC (YdhE family)
MGSSGHAELLPEILRSLAPLNITVIAATAGANVAASGVPANAHVAAYLPGAEAARRSRLVICNGGSPTSQQALAAGVSVIGIASNLDQFLNMDAIARAGAGVTLRGDRFDRAQLRTAVETLLAGRSYAKAAGQLAEAIAKRAALIDFAALVLDVLGGSPPGSSMKSRA